MYVSLQCRHFKNSILQKRELFAKTALLRFCNRHEWNENSLCCLNQDIILGLLIHWQWSRLSTVAVSNTGVYCSNLLILFYTIDWIISTSLRKYYMDFNINNFRDLYFVSKFHNLPKFDSGFWVITFTKHYKKV